ncbi:MarR family winged helix-turn-helix transcriptional regulator [Plebeiibacterium sediminum]|uniref:HTH-type transcriptional regulator SarZ n=1 Tax=Plebeiibacterium sediminum TaxID=2992112 RepID=A0AAE3M5R6_9BACT|nr:MarR family transcriptional regulator [Plebeiobacterium sediminum]MCW3787407.1 MarR family transcriptional regulator [Plebeiobacterium sediminum]
MSHDPLKLENQLCFPVYAVSRLFTREYQPYLDKLNITYPQYLVLMILWETDQIGVNDIAKKLILNTNTVTPLLKRMETQQLIERSRSADDERKVIVKLTSKGKKLKNKASEIPQSLSHKLLDSSLNIEDLIDLKKKLETIIEHLTK